uniref:Uncharacterized protein n=1 Tax=Octopus bimaculoides TaxID=37653 RepID=A0A0L8GEG2_OCTBM
MKFTDLIARNKKEVRKSFMWTNMESGYNLPLHSGQTDHGNVSSIHILVLLFHLLLYN